uniref:Uncharacterized protein n=1 Tax=Rhizophora mucronata TaxID=61149 RepID=A0A2P2MY96_RHIMU
MAAGLNCFHLLLHHNYCSCPARMLLKEELQYLCSLNYHPIVLTNVPYHNPFSL